MGKEFKPLTVSDFGLSPEQLKILVTGAQKFFGPRLIEAESTPGDDVPAPTPEDNHADRNR